MNDNELDEMLNQWKEPVMRESLREDLRAGFVARPEPKRTLRRLAFATMTAAALLFAIIQVSPRTISMASPGFRIPFYVEFEFERYADDGSAPHQSRITSFPYGGHEIVMSVTESGDSLLNTVRGIASSVRNQFILAIPSFVLPKQLPMAEPDWFAGFVRSGCSEGRTMIGHEIIAGHMTTVLESSAPTDYRIKVWMAQDLACFALKLTHEVKDANSTYRLKIRKEAVTVTMNP
jgi:hypothetical protein